MRDARLWSHTDHAISRTVAKVGPIVTSAAVLFAVSIEVFGTAKMIVLKILGVGTALAVLTNAIRVCGLALPAVMVLLGRSAWWLPATR